MVHLTIVTNESSLEIFFNFHYKSSEILLTLLELGVEIITWAYLSNSMRCTSQDHVSLIQSSELGNIFNQSRNLENHASGVVPLHIFLVNLEREV